MGNLFRAPRTWVGSWPALAFSLSGVQTHVPPIRTPKGQACCGPPGDWPVSWAHRGQKAPRGGASARQCLGLNYVFLGGVNPEPGGL